MLDENDVRRMIAAKLENKTQRELAADIGVSCQYLNDYLRFRRDPGPKILKSLGLRRVSMYQTITVESDPNKMRPAALPVCFVEAMRETSR